MRAKGISTPEPPAEDADAVATPSQFSQDPLAGISRDEQRMADGRSITFYWLKEPEPGE